MAVSSFFLLLFLLASCSATSVNLTLGPPVGSYTSAHTVGVNLGAPLLRSRGARLRLFSAPLSLPSVQVTATLATAPGSPSCRGWA